MKNRPPFPSPYASAPRRTCSSPISWSTSCGAKKPLVVMTPKSFLRLKEARSAEKELTEGRFQEVLGDPAAPEKVERVVLARASSSGTCGRRGAIGVVALVRVEQPYPFPGEAIKKELERFDGAEVVWAQEEPENMGAAWFVQRNLRRFGVERGSWRAKPAAAPPPAR